MVLHITPPGLLWAAGIYFIIIGCHLLSCMCHYILGGNSYIIESLSMTFLLFAVNVKLNLSKKKKFFLQDMLFIFHLTFI